MSEELRDEERETLHNLQETARVLENGCPACAAPIAAWNAAVGAENGETTAAFIRRMKAAQK